MRTELVLVALGGWLAACSGGGDEPAAGTGSAPSATPLVGITSPSTTGAVVASTVSGGPPAPSASTSPPLSIPSRCAEPTNGPHEIELWHTFAPDADPLFVELVEAFNDSQSDVVVTAVKKDNYGTLLEEFQTVPESELPDVIIGSEVSIAALHGSGLMVKPGECTAGSEPFPDLLPVAEATYTVNGELVAVPYNVSTPVLLFNATTVRAAGLDPDDPPTTPAELRAASDAVVASGAAPYGFVVSDTVGTWILRQWTAQRGEVIVEPDNGRGECAELVPRFNTPAIRADFEWLQDGAAAGAFVWLGPNPSGTSDLLRLVQGERVAFTLHTSAAIGGLLAIEAAGTFPGQQLGVGPLPGSAPGGLVGGGALWVVDRGDARRAGAAWSAVDWLMQPAQLAALDAATGYAPPRMSVTEEALLLDAWAADPELRVAYDQLAAMPGNAASGGILAVPTAALDLTMNLATDTIVHGGDVANVLREAEEGFRRLLVEFDSCD